jgi:hypothetical protein
MMDLWLFSESKLRTKFDTIHEKRNVTSLPYFGHRKINRSEPRVKASDSVAASVTGTAVSVRRF